MNADNVSKVLDQLALRFGATGAELWSRYWHATQFFAATCMLLSVGFGAVCFVASERIAIEHDDLQWVRPACMILAAGIIALGVAANLTDVVMPQGAALHSLMGK